MRRNIVLFALVSLLSSSCALFTGKANVPDSPSSLEVTVFQKAFMSSYYAERVGKPGGAASGMALSPFAARESGPRALATVPVGSLSDKTFAKAVSSPQSFPNYPEPAQTTTFTASKYDDNGGKPVYAIRVSTSFPSSDARESYVEEYYVKDSNAGDTAADGNWTIDDPIVKSSGGSWVVDLAARSKMLLTFRDGTTRSETIVSSSLSADGRLLDPKAFDIDGSLAMDDAFLPDKAPATGPLESGVKYSSVVMYYVTPAMNYNFWFWQGSSQQTILGIRYYTEVADKATETYTAYTTSFEKAISALTTTGGSFTSTLKTVFAGSTFDTLAESVLRQRVAYGLDQTSGADAYYIPKGVGAITTNMQTRVVNIAGKKDFFLKQMDSDQVRLSSWADSTIYVPEGDVDEILAGNASDGLFTRNQQITPAAGTLPFAVETLDRSGLGDLATLYTSITQGSAAAAAANAPPGSNLTGSNVYSFNGQQAFGHLIESDAMPDLSQKGTVEAWVYVNSMTDTAGIVHKGTAKDFADECYSLQGWGSSGQVAIVLNPQAGSNYDLVTSSKNLNKKAWYYLVATWDRTASPKKINLYINGASSGSGTMSNTATGVRHNASDIIIGSQLPVQYSSAYGYFGLDGKIVGAAVSDSVLTADQVKAKYNANKGNASSW